MIRLVHVLPTFALGGTELRVLSIINGQGQQFSHTIVPLNGVTSALSRAKESAQVTVAPPPSRAPYPIYANRLLRFLRSLKPNLLLTYNWGAMDAVAAARIGGLCPVIHNECGFGPDEAKRLKLRRILCRRLLLNTIPITIVVSAALKEIALRAYRLRSDRVRLIRTGVDCEAFAPGRNEQCRRNLGMNRSGVLFGYVGGLRPEKNLPFLIAAFAKAAIPDSHLVLIGEGPLRPALLKLCSELGIERRVTFAGAVTEMAPWFNAMDVFLMSSKTEQTPNALLEAMASGLPAVCTDAGDTSTILDSVMPEAVVSQGDLGAYVQAMAALAANPDCRTFIGARNRARTLSSFSRSSMIANYTETYLSVIQNTLRKRC